MISLVYSQDIAHIFFQGFFCPYKKKRPCDWEWAKRFKGEAESGNGQEIPWFICQPIFKYRKSLEWIFITGKLECNAVLSHIKKGNIIRTFWHLEVIKTQFLVKKKVLQCFKLNYFEGVFIKQCILTLHHLTFKSIKKCVDFPDPSGFPEMDFLFKVAPD